MTFEIRCPRCGKDPNGPGGEIPDPPGPPDYCDHGPTTASTPHDGQTNAAQPGARGTAWDGLVEGGGA